MTKKDFLQQKYCEINQLKNLLQTYPKEYCETIIKVMEKVFDEIVEFSELGQFINSPIRTYSSGMYARLGFAVATAHVPDILILDEILSVGDEAFQKKSRERLLSFQERGATVLMVSHALDSMIGMCNRIAWLDQGNLRLIGEPDDVISAYREENI